MLSALLTLAGPARAGKLQITFFAAGYTPEITSGDNPYPLHEFTRIAHEWEALHPEAEVVFVRQPVGDYLTWLLTQMKGGIGPDILWAEGNWCNDYAKNNWFVKLNPYLEQPNPYVPDNRRWVDIFYEHWIAQRCAPDGSLYSLPVDLNETGVYYNKDIFRQAGVAVPETWAQLIDACSRTQDAGYVPFAIAAKQYGAFCWVKWVLHDQLWRDVLPAADVRGRFPNVDDQEMVRAYRKGLWSPRDPRYVEMLRLLKEWAQFWNRDAMAGTPEEERLFRLGKAAMYLHGSWYLPNLLHDPLRAFDFGVFPLPGLTKTSSPYGLDETGPAPGVGGAGATQYAITTNAVRGGKLDLAVDFMRYFTAPHNLERLVDEAGITLPNGPGMKVNPVLQPFAKALEARRYAFPGQVSVRRHYDHEFRVLQSYIGGTYSVQQAVDSMDTSAAEAMDRLVRDNPQWAFSRDWDILPDLPQADQAKAGADGAWQRRGPWVIPVALLLAMLGVVVAQAARDWRRARAKLGIYPFLLPTLLLIVLFQYYPISSAFYYSLFDWKQNGDAVWVGLQNFRDILHDQILGESTFNLLKLMAAGMVISVTVPLAAAELIFHLRNERLQYLYRVLFVIPMIVPGVVTLLIWGFIYDYNMGLANQVLRAIGLNSFAQAWLADPRIALYSLILIGFPWIGGFGLLIYTAGLQAIPTDVLDSCKLDGATGLRRIWAIDIPLVMAQIKLMIVLCVIGGIQGFQTQLLLTDGGPGYSTMVPGLSLYQNSMLYDRMGYACAIGVVLFVVILCVTYINMKYIKSSTEYEKS